MYSKEPDIASLISSRICHDLVSPLGAISNGLELLELSGIATAAPEYGLLNDSVANATARINFFRYAFGAREGSVLSESTIHATLDGFYAGTRIEVSWKAEGDVSRLQAKLALLLIQCLETFLPVGGRITASCDNGNWRLAATDDRLRPDRENLAHLLGGSRRPALKPSEIQFELARRILTEERVAAQSSATEREFSLSYRFPKR